MVPRLYLPAVNTAAAEAEADSEFELSSQARHYLLKVLRLRRGSELVVYDGAGNAYRAFLSQATRDYAGITLIAALPAAAADSGKDIHIGQMLCAPAKMDWAIEKMTELGASTITPLSRDGANYPPESAQKQRWERLAIAACSQCGRNRLPLFLPRQTIADWQPAEDSYRILLTPRARQRLHGDMLPSSPAALTIAVGDESGFSDTEEQQLINAGFQPAHLGARILRSETAALAALALLKE